jgi:hypothetical protein
LVDTSNFREYIKLWLTRTKHQCQEASGQSISSNHKNKNKTICQAVF